MNNTDYASGTTLKNDRPTGWPEMLYFSPPNDEQIDALIADLLDYTALPDESQRTTVRKWLANL